MSISLNDHENRIKALENGKYFSETLLWSGSISTPDEGNINLSQPIDNFDYLLVMMSTYKQHNDTGFTQQIFFVNHIIKNGYKFQCDTGLRQIVFVKTDNLIYRVYDAVSALIEGMPSKFADIGRIRQIIGLKIYYIFRYNICEILKLISPILKF